ISAASRRAASTAGCGWSPRSAATGPARIFVPSSDCGGNPSTRSGQGTCARIAAFMDRRTLLKTGGLALAGFGLTGCGAPTRSAVIGCGAPGLTAARQLQRRGFDVTIYAMTVPPDTTSNMSLAGFTPTTALVDNTRRTPEWDAQFRQAAELSYRQLQLMVSPH